LVDLPGTANCNSILVASRDTGDYRAALQPLADEGCALAYAETAHEALQAYHGQGVLLAQPDIAAAVIDLMPSVHWVQSTWAGITPLLHTRRQDFVLTGIKEVFGPQMAEYCCGQILAHELQSGPRFQKQRERQWWHEPTGRLAGKTLGIMGLGSIGRHIARVASAFGVRLWGLSRGGAAVEGFAEVYAVAQLHEFLKGCDYVAAVLPDTPDTTGLMDAAAFAAMKPTAVFINVGRGNLVDEDALANALHRGQLAGAVLDVFRTEPLPEGSPLWTTPNLVITGHVAARSWPMDIARIFLENLGRYRQGLGLNYVIDRERGY
jgi:phosphoglycerate dehydrogenase-like enzyme